MNKNLDKIIKVSLYSIVFLMPLWFLPYTSSVLEFNKQALLVLLTFVSLFAWLLKSLVRGEITFKKIKLSGVVLVFLIVAGLSTWLSLYRYASFWGWPLSIASSFLTTLSLCIFFLLLINNFEKEDIFGMLFLLILSAFLVSTLSLWQLFGKFMFPFSFAQSTSFNTVGTINSLSVFVGALLPLVLSLLFISKKLVKFLFSIFCFVAMVLMLIVNFWVGWFAVLVGSIIILVFGISRKETFKMSWLTIPMLFLVIAIFFGIFKVGLPGLPATPLEVSPSQKASLDIAQRVIRKSPIFGTGPGTFNYNYSQFKPETVNQTAFWAVRFSSATSEVLEYLATSGLFGFMSFIAILGVFFRKGLKRLVNQKEKKESLGAMELYDWILSMGIFASWVSLIVSMFLYPANLVLKFLFWFLTAVMAVLIEDNKVKTWKLETASTASIGFSFLFILILIMGLGLFFMQGQRYYAEIKYGQGLQAWQSGDNTEAINAILSAVSQTGGKQDNYWRDLSQIYLLQAQEELQNTERDKEETGKVVSALISNAVNSGKAATDTAPSNVANWIVRGFVYRQVIGVIDGAGDWAVDSYEKALGLEPNNPYVLTELGRVYIAKKEVESAREKFREAIGAKSDYAPARFQTALTYVEEDKISEAITEMESAKQVSPTDVGVAFQLGLLYYNDDQLTKAGVEFERAVRQNENYSNARYFLGLVLSRKGKTDDAIKQFEKIQELNQDNQELTKIIANLKAGKSALDGIAQEESIPIEEKPEEVLK